jgi:amidase/aspartyl-tRNA(Asn)/glutamyl-tRNA(Gln) amidotransferase subunit A
VTAAGSKILREAAPAARDAPAVARLRAAGAAFVGRTHMSEFAFSGIGINPHLPRLVNPATLALDPVARAPGGSTSGGAASVAAGAAWVALGSDTGGSIRIPAALQGIVGFKSTARLVPTAAPCRCATLDTVSAMTRSVRDAVVLHESSPPDVASQRPAVALALRGAATLVLDGLDATVARAVRAQLAALSAGREIDDDPLARLPRSRRSTPTALRGSRELGVLHRRWIVERESEYDRRVALASGSGETKERRPIPRPSSPARRDWIARMGDGNCKGVRRPADADGADRRAAARAARRRRRRVLRRQRAGAAQSERRQLLDGCALSVPCHADGELPVGYGLEQRRPRRRVLDAAWRSKRRSPHPPARG